MMPPPYFAADDATAVLRRLLKLDAPSTEPEPETEIAIPEPLVPQVKEEKPKERKPVKKATRPKARARAAKGSLLPASEYEIPLLEALDELGGYGPAAAVMKRLREKEKLDDKLTAIDLEKVKSGEVRWKSRTQFVRISLIRAGYMRDDSPRGTWEIAPAGLARLHATQPPIEEEDEDEPDAPQDPAEPEPAGSESAGDEAAGDD